MLVDAEHEVHVLHGLPAGALQEVVDDAGDEQLVLELLYVDECLVGVHHLLQIQVALDVVREGCCIVELPVHLHDVLFRHVGVYTHHLGAEDTSCEVAAVRDEVHG